MPHEGRSKGDTWLGLVTEAVAIHAWALKPDDIQEFLSLRVPQQRLTKQQFSKVAKWVSVLNVIVRELTTSHAS